MDFGERLPRKAGQPGPDGHYEWERPGQKARWEEARKADAAAHAPRSGVTPTNYRTVGDADMMIRDGLSRAEAFAGAFQVSGTAAESGCEPVSGLWYPPAEPGFGPWIDGEVPEGTPGRGQVLYASEQRRETAFDPYEAPMKNFWVWGDVVAYRLRGDL